jgi:hypothetical protein
MEARETVQQRTLREKRLANRLRLASTRVEEADRERLWAIAAAHAAGLSVRKIATATGLSSSRMHQLLHTAEANEIPMGLSQLQERDLSPADNAPPDQSPPQPEFQARLADEVEVLRWCSDWLDWLECGEEVIVNLRPDTDPETAFVGLTALGCSGCWLALPLTSMSPLADQRSPLQMLRSMTRLPLEFGTVNCWLNPNRRSHNLASVNNVRFYGNSSGCRL